MSNRRIASAAALACAATSLALAPGALAKTYVPNTTGDHVPGTQKSKLTLREAVIKAKNHGGADTIVLQSDKRYELSQPVGTEDDDIGLVQANGDLDIFDADSKGLTIISSGRELATVDANGIAGVFECRDRCTLQRIRVTGGNATNDGGGLEGEDEGGVTPSGTGGRIVLIDSRVSGNHADGDGGGVSSDVAGLKVLRTIVSGNNSGASGGGLAVEEGGVSIKQSTVKGNTSASDGGGIWNTTGTSIKQSTIRGNTAGSISVGGFGGGIFNGGSLVLKESTVSGNLAPEANFGNGAGLYNAAAVATLTNDTFAKNEAGAYGGGIHTNGGSVRMNAVTVAYNLSDSNVGGSGQGGGLYEAGGGLFNVRNSLIARNSSGLDNGPNCFDVDANGITSLGHNLVGDNTDCDGFLGGALSSDRVNRSNSQVGIGDLKSNGGPTKTIALKSGSQAIDHAGSDAPSKDQRGVRRNDPGGPDIGAFERN